MLSRMLSWMIIITVASISSQLSSIGTSIENRKLKETQLAASIILLFIYLVVTHKVQCRIQCRTTCGFNLKSTLINRTILLFIYLVVTHRIQCRTTSAQGNTQSHSSNVAQQLSDQRKDIHHKKTRSVVQNY